MGIFNFGKDQQIDNQTQSKALTQLEIDDLLSELNSLVGLNNVKQCIRQVVEEINLHKRLGTEYRYSRGCNFMFLGNPGTGKTTVAMMLGKILYGCGYLSSDEVKAYTPADFISGYIGETSQKVTNIFKENIGHILFIDEAYGLCPSDDSVTDFGREALSNIIMNMEQFSGKVSVIFAGYTDETKRLLDAETGLQSRVPYQIEFNDFSNEELWQIFENNLSKDGLSINEEECKPRAYAYFDAARRDKFFSNARVASRLCEIVCREQNTRVVAMENCSDNDFKMILPKDFPKIQSEDLPQTQPEEKAKDEIMPVPGTQEVEETKSNVDNEIKNGIENILRNIADIDSKIEVLSQNQPVDDDISASIKNMELNVQQLVQNQGSASDIAVMRRENEAFRSDSNMKLMRAYGIDAMIKTYQGICDQIFKINHSADGITDSADGEKKAYEWVLKRMERQFKRLGIKLQKSEPGEEIDEEYMEVYGSDGSVDIDEKLTMVQTENSDLKNTVKESVCPAFIWTIPSLIGEQKEWVMEPEKICMYK